MRAAGSLHPWSAPPERPARPNRTRSLMAPAMRQHGVLITISVMVASIMQSLDTTIANVALPRIQGSLSSTQDQITWVLINI